MTTPLKVTPVHFATRIEQTPHTSTETMYFALCGYVGYAAEMFSNDKGVVLQRQGGRVTCERCVEKIGAKTT